MTTALGVVLDAHRAPCPHCGKRAVELSVRYYLRSRHGLASGDATASRCPCVRPSLPPMELTDGEQPAWEGP